MRKLLLVLLPSIAFAGGPKYTYPSPRGLDDEMQNIYHLIPNKATTPTAYIGAGAPSFSPYQIGDIYISTTTSKVYIATATVTNQSWAIVN